jgi:four helix bundle protein
MFRFEELEIWKLSLKYADKCYYIASKFPEYERNALADQLRRAVISISNNIAEGSGSPTSKGFSAFLDISIKSTLETVNILFFATRRNYIKKNKNRNV